MHDARDARQPPFMDMRKITEGITVNGSRHQYAPGSVCMVNVVESECQKIPDRRW